MAELDQPEAQDSAAPVVEGGGLNALHAAASVVTEAVSELAANASQALATLSDKAAGENGEPEEKTNGDVAESNAQAEAPFNENIQVTTPELAASDADQNPASAPEPGPVEEFIPPPVQVNPTENQPQGTCDVAKSEETPAEEQQCEKVAENQVEVNEASADLPDQYEDFVSGDVAPEYDDADQYADYCGGQFDEVSLEEVSSIQESDSSSVKKKKGRVRSGLMSIASGGAKIVLGTKDIVVGTGKGTVRGAQKAGGAVVHGVEAVGQGTVKAAGAVVDGTKAGAVAIGHGTAKVAGAVVDGTKAGAGAVVHGVEAVGQGTVRAAGAVVDGTKAGAVAIGHGTAKVAGAVVDGVEAVGHGTAKAAGAVVDGTKAGVVAVGHGTAKVAGAVADGAKAGAGAVVHGVEAVGHGTVKAAGAVVDGTIAGAEFVAGTTVKAATSTMNAVGNVAEGVKDTTTTFAKASIDAVTDVVSTGVSGASAVGHGIENAAQNVANHAQRGMVDALTLGLKVVDPNVAVVHKAITAKEEN